MSRLRSFLTVKLRVLLLLTNVAAATQVSITLPPDFTDTLITSVASPTALSFTPDGRLLIATQPGQLRVYQNGALLQTPALDLADVICSDFERGLLGIAVDPEFASNHFIYTYYTYKKFPGCEHNTSHIPVNRVSRFTLSDSNMATGEVVLVDNLPSPNGNHNAGDLHFGKDGYLYISVGDGGCDYADDSGCAGENDATRDQFILLGKVLRITRDGAIPPDNPFQGNGTARCNVTGRTAAQNKCQETFAWGLRNPFRLAFDPNDAGTRFFVNDVGQNIWEEIDLGQAAADYGWNIREGHCANGSTTDCGPPPAGITNPIYDYGHTDGCTSITGGAFVPSGIWPAAYDGAYLFSDYVCGKIFMLQPANGGGYTATEFATGLGNGSAVALSFGPAGTSQALYYTTYADGGQVRRIAHTGTANRPPTAAVTADPTFGAVPLAVSFNGSQSSDPDFADTLTYIWNFGDGTTDSETSSSTITYTYNVTGTYTATLRVRDNHNTVSDPSTIRIDVGNTPPVPTIESPAADLLFRVGQEVILRGSAIDAEDGPLSDTALSWRVILHHNDHTHPFLPLTTGNNIAITTPPPEDLAATHTSYLEIELTATDSLGLTRTITQTLRPHLVDVTFTTVPDGLNLIVNSSPITAPKSLASWEGYALNVLAPAQLDATGQWLGLQIWSDGDSSPSRTITTPSSTATYTATFAPSEVMLVPLLGQQ